MRVMSPNASFNRQEASFIYFQLLINILLRIEDTNGNARKEIIDECRQQYAGNDKELKNIDDFEMTYSVNKAVWWYNHECFINRVLNKALRTADIDVLFKLQFFIKDLHRQLSHLHSTNKVQTIVAYRGQGMVTEEFEKLRANVGGFLSMSSLLSTSIKRDVALSFARRSLNRLNVQSVLFKITVDTKKCSRSFPNVEKASWAQTDHEILFSTSTVFRIASVKKLDNCDIWNVKLTLDGEEDEQLRQLTEHMWLEIKGSKDFFTLGNLLLKMAEYDQAEQLYMMILDNITENDPDVGHIYKQLGYIYKQRNSSQQALIDYNKCLDVELKYLSLEPPLLAIPESNTGMVYSDQAAQEQTLVDMEKALEIENKTICTDESYLAKTYNNIAMVYYNKKEYHKALDYYHKTLSIDKATLPTNPPLLGATYNNIAGVHYSKGDYVQALKYLEITLQIELSSLSTTHPSVAVTYWNIGLVHGDQQNWTEALRNFTAAYQIAKKSNHPDMQKYQQHVEIANAKLQQFNSR
ncbi:unnamed protein product [Didymodactylos carnosus]|uniref:Uncharacterized protein n=1 Tax=Didymodactylos carnosus TaxID=1234261 RepID=A0A814LDH5_9BILA|nr:unnamed protein product [Didymodactylos carnosus]CAF1198617.1 unnamed protein product [Didymodactylos carnosus]CAF3831718.1 unnamed protein product [Didymodactylos carnosus]CAF4008772.1 unnamed protein product [Didymodactylos carnosus]